MSLSFALRLKHSSGLCNSLCSRFHHHLSRHPSEGIHSSTGVEAFELSTERRARERQEYERLASEKEALRMLMEEEQRQEEERREKEEIARLRQEQVTAKTLFAWKGEGEYSHRCGAIYLFIQYSIIWLSFIHINWGTFLSISGIVI